jgi:hypothetical protein
MPRQGAITKVHLRVTSQGLKSGQHFYGAVSDVGEKVCMIYIARGNKENKLQIKQAFDLLNLAVSYVVRCLHA